MAEYYGPEDVSRQKIPLIKQIRMSSALSLAESKKIADELVESPWMQDYIERHVAFRTRELQNRLSDLGTLTDVPEEKLAQWEIDLLSGGF